MRGKGREREKKKEKKKREDGDSSVGKLGSHRWFYFSYVSLKITYRLLYPIRAVL